MSRRTIPHWLILVAAACALNESAAFGACLAHHVSGGVTIQRRPGPDAQASGDFTVYNYLGNIDFGCQLFGALEIHNVYSPSETIASSIGGGIGNMVTLARGRADFDNCYRAYFNASVTAYPSLTRAWNSSQLCIEPHPPISPPEENCPIVLDLGENGLALAAPGVRFDIDADGELETLGWVQAGGVDPLLCRDVNGNGVIDDGSELVGYASRLLNGELAGIGYLLLADLDSAAFGGNEDGVLASTEPGFQELCLWHDWDGDAETDPDEVRGLASTEIRGLGYDFVHLESVDETGNVLRFEGDFWVRRPNGRVSKRASYDVVFAGEASD